VRSDDVRLWNKGPGKTANYMNKILRKAFTAVWLSAAMLPATTGAQAPAAPAPAPPRRLPQASPVTNVTVDGNEAMFTTMCALLAAVFESIRQLSSVVRSVGFPLIFPHSLLGESLWLLALGSE